MIISSRYLLFIALCCSQTTSTFGLNAIRGGNYDDASLMIINESSDSDQAKALKNHDQIDQFESKGEELENICGGGGAAIFDQGMLAAGTLAIACAPQTLGMSLLIGAALQFMNLAKNAACDINDSQELLEKISQMIEKKIDQRKIELVEEYLNTIAQFIDGETDWTLKDALIGRGLALTAITHAYAIGMPGLKLMLITFQELFFFDAVSIGELEKTKSKNTKEYIEAKAKLVKDAHYLAEKLTDIQAEFDSEFRHGSAKLYLYWHARTCGGYYIDNDGKQIERGCYCWCSSSACNNRQFQITLENNNYVQKAQDSLFSEEVKKMTSTLFMISSKTIIEFNALKDGVRYVEYYIKENWNGAPWHNIQKTAQFNFSKGKWVNNNVITSKSEVDLTTNSNNNLLNAKFKSGYFSQPFHVPTLTFSGIPQDHGDFNGVYERSTEKYKGFNTWYNEDKTAYFYKSHLTDRCWFLVRVRDSYVLLKSIGRVSEDLITAHFDEAVSHPW